MATKALPALDVLSQLVRYEPDTGFLYWLPRAPDMFSGDVRRCNAWNTMYSGERAFASVKDNLYLYGRLFDKNQYAHRVAFFLSTGIAPPQIDHINGNRQDNRLVNLRASNAVLNARNSARRSDNTTGRTGVYNYDGIWIVHGGKRRIGKFPSFAEAVAARNQFERDNGYSTRHGTAATQDALAHLLKGK